MHAVLRPDIDALVATGVTADELATRGDDGYRYDLIEGDLIRMSPGGFRHGRLAAELAFQLRGFLARHPELGVVVGAETGFRLARDPDTVLGPDAAVVRRDRLPPAFGVLPPHCFQKKATRCRSQLSRRPRAHSGSHALKPIPLSPPPITQ